MDKSKKPDKWTGLVLCNFLCSMLKKLNANLTMPSYYRDMGQCLVFKHIMKSWKFESTHLSVFIINHVNRIYMTFTEFELLFFAQCKRRVC